MVGAMAASLLMMLLCILVAERSEAQPRPRYDAIQVGIGVLPGIGFQVGYVEPAVLYTREIAVYSDVVPKLLGAEGSVQAAATFGASIRVVGIFETLRSLPPQKTHLDVGLRLGPGLKFAFNNTRVAKNQRFTLGVEPFARVSTRLSPKYHFFAEAGVLRPVVRFGAWITI